MFISNLWVVLTIRVVNLMIGLSSTVNLHQRRRTSYESDAPRLVYILEKNCKPDGAIRFTFANEILNRMAPHPVYNFFPKCKPDVVPSDSHFHLEMWTGWPPSGLPFFSKYKPDEVSSDSHFEKNYKQDGGHPV